MGRFLDEAPVSAPISYTPKGKFLDEPAQSAPLSSFQFNPINAIKPVVNATFGPLATSTFLGTPIEKQALNIAGKPFEYGLSRPVATALAGWPTAEQEFAKVQKPMDMFGAIGRTLTSTTGPQLYEQAGYRKEIAEPLGGL